MRVVHICRKPSSEGTVAKNVLKHGTGAINIDASRVGTPFISAGGNNFDVWRSGEGRSDRPSVHGNPTAKVQSGRWPANLILQHLPGCKQAGTKKVRDCQQGCPVAELDSLSGQRPSTWTNTKEQKPSAALPESKYRPGQGNYQPQGQLYSDNGTAARFFKQVGGKRES